MLKKLLLSAVLAAVGFASEGYAQIVIPLVPNVGNKDLFGDIVGGYAGMGNEYATAAQINGVIGYQNAGVLATGQTILFGNATQLIAAQSSGTIATLTLTAAANPGDGQINCYFNIAATTAITWNANTGQTIANAPTAGVANTRYCMLFSQTTNSWVRAQ
jgi:hypothetical protein